MKKRLYKQTSVDVVMMLIIGAFTLLCLVPFLYIISVSTSNEVSIVSHKVTVYPIGINFEAYRTVFADQSILRSFIFSIALVFLSTSISMFLTICMAYPLTKVKLKGRGFFFVMIVVTMYFSGGIIPDFIMVKNLHLLDTIWALVLPSAISTFNVIIMKTFFTNSVPQSVEEAAAIDGCNDIVTLVRIVLPLSVPVLACLSLFYAVGRWNGFQDALFYITNSNLYTLQLKLYQLVYNNQAIDTSAMETISVRIPTEGLKAATIVVATIPIMLVYPWLQRYFSVGITIGAVKE